MTATASFRAVVQGAGKTAAGIVVPAEVLEQLGHGKRPPVRVTIGGHTYRSTVAVMGGRYMIGISAENRAQARVAVGDDIGVQIELDLEPRVVALPDDFAAALTADPAAQAFFGSLSYSHRQRHVLAVEAAKKPETRQRRIEKSIAMLHEGRAQ